MDPGAQALYRDAIHTVIGRTNSINGRRYVDDPGLGRPWPHHQRRLDVEGGRSVHRRSPQEAQGLFSLFDSDVSTLEIVSAHAKAMRAID